MNHHLFSSSSPTVSTIRTHVEHTPQHPVNHVLIYYHSSTALSLERSYKMIDVVRVLIVNLSLGSRRTMTLRTKNDATANTDDDGGGGVQHTTQLERVPPPNNSLFVMGLETKFPPDAQCAYGQETFGEH